MYSTACIHMYSGIWKRLRFNYLIMVLNSNIGIVDKESSFRKNCSTQGQSKLEQGNANYKV